MIHYDNTAIEAVNRGHDIPDAFYHKSTLIASSKWVNTDGWRGFNQLTPEPGWLKVDEDFATDEWGDAVSEDHGPNAQERKYKALEARYGEIWVIYTPTSNVFSTGQDILARNPAVKPVRGKTIAHKTKLFKEDNGDWRVRYHATNVVSYNAAENRYTLDTGGWNTKTTAKRMTEALPGDYYVYRKNWVMYVHTPDGDLEIKDGMEV